MNNSVTTTQTQRNPQQARTFEPGLVSIIIPTYNRASLVGGAIDSALAQTYRPVEIIVVDDGSADGTASVLAGYGDRILHIVQKNAGPSAARNSGIRACRGEWVAFLDSDDRWSPSKLEAQMHLVREKNLKTCFTQVLWQTDPNQVPAFPEVRKGNAAARVFMEPLELLLDQSMPNMLSTLLVERLVLMRVGCFDERFSRAEDNLLFFRLAFEGPFGFLEDGHVAMDRIADRDRLSLDSTDNSESMLQVFTSILLRFEAYFRCEKRSKAVVQRLRRVLGRYLCRMAVLHSLNDNPGDARRLAWDALHFVHGIKDRSKCWSVLISPELLARIIRSKKRPPPSARS